MDSFLACGEPAHPESASKIPSVACVHCGNRPGSSRKGRCIHTFIYMCVFRLAIRHFVSIRSICVAQVVGRTN